MVWRAAHALGQVVARDGLVARKVAHHALELHAQPTFLLNLLVRVLLHGQAVALVHGALRKGVVVARVAAPWRDHPNPPVRLHDDRTAGRVLPRLECRERFVVQPRHVRDGRVVHNPRLLVEGLPIHAGGLLIAFRLRAERVHARRVNRLPVCGGQAHASRPLPAAGAGEAILATTGSDCSKASRRVHTPL